MDKLFRLFFGLACLMLATGQGIPVGLLNMNVTNSECGTSRACFTDPAGCNPETNTSCLFVSTQSSSGNLNFQLRGESAGFIAVVLSVDTTAGGNDTTYICTTTSNFLVALLDNNTLTVQNDNSSISNVSASVSNETIQCVFEVSGLNASAPRSAHNTFSVALGSGDLVGGLPSNLNLRAIIPSVNLANPNSTNTATSPNTTDTTNSTDTTNATTTTPASTTTTTASGANISLQHGFSQALLIVLGVLAMSLL